MKSDFTMMLKWIKLTFASAPSISIETQSTFAVITLFRIQTFGPFVTFVDAKFAFVGQFTRFKISSVVSFFTFTFESTKMTHADRVFVAFAQSLLTSNNKLSSLPGGRYVWEKNWARPETEGWKRYTRLTAPSFFFFFSFHTDGPGKVKVFFAWWFVCFPLCCERCEYRTVVRIVKSYKGYKHYMPIGFEDLTWPRPSFRAKVL